MPILKRTLKLIIIFAALLFISTTAAEAAFRYNQQERSNTQEFCFESLDDCEARVSAVLQASGNEYQCYEVASCDGQTMIPSYQPPEAYDITARLQNPINSTDLFDLFREIYRGIMTIIIPILVVVIVYSGFIFVSAQGNDEKLKKAKKNALYAAIGIAIILGAEVILSVFEALSDALGAV